MKVTKIRIKNFKSIKDEITLEVKKIADKDCLILLGINESGKSNILEAISLHSREWLEANYNAESNNYSSLYNIALGCEAEVERKDISVICELQIDNSDKEVLIERGINKHLVNIVEIEKIERLAIISPESEIKYSYQISIEENKKEFKKYVLDNANKRIELMTDTVAEDAGKNIKEADQIAKVENNDQTEYGDDKERSILDKEKLENILENYAEDLFDFPKIIFWKSSEEKYLINKMIDLNEFKDNLDISIPLKNCFRIAGIKNIKEKIDSINDNPGSAMTLTDLLDKKVTEHINKVWGEHKINIRFAINAMQFSIFIEEKDRMSEKYDFNQRSDGFKHFFSILLNLSAENKTGQLKNNIILLDEPELHLHPSGQKYLRDELLKIAENNLVIYATHSIYMVDKLNIDRHLSIKKEEGITKLSTMGNDNPYKEEVLYQALGTSVLEHIEDTILIVEGKHDKYTFDLYKRRFKDEIESPNITLIAADGCANIKLYTKFATNNLIKWFVLTDSDKDGKKTKEALLKEAKNYGEGNLRTFEINDITHIVKDATLEDLFDPELISKSVCEVYGPTINLNTSRSFLNQINNAMINKHEINDNKKSRDLKIMRLKQAIFQRITSLSTKDLRNQKYFEFFKKLNIELNK